MNLSIDDNLNETIQITVFVVGFFALIAMLVFSVDGPPERTKLDGNECVIIQEQLYCEVNKE